MSLFRLAAMKLIVVSALNYRGTFPYDSLLRPNRQCRHAGIGNWQWLLGGSFGSLWTLCSSEKDGQFLRVSAVARAVPSLGDVRICVSIQPSFGKPFELQHFLIPEQLNVLVYSFKRLGILGGSLLKQWVALIDIMINCHVGCPTQV
jgi:hypothetical protein